jgi:hypothetical protein
MSAAAFLVALRVFMVRKGGIVGVVGISSSVLGVVLFMSAAALFVVLRVFMGGNGGVVGTGDIEFSALRAVLSMSALLPRLRVIMGCNNRRRACTRGNWFW